MTIHQKIKSYYDDAGGEHHRYRSWEHCYGYFRAGREAGLALNRDQAALHLAFYLASWGMYRGSSFLLQNSYTVHRRVIDLIAEDRFTALWNTEFGGTQTDDEFVPTIHELIDNIRLAYKPFVPVQGSGQPTDTLITKIILGTFGCLPACDRYFIDGFKRQKLKYSRLNDQFVHSILRFCHTNLSQLRRAQAKIQGRSSIRYPLMKLADMYFWQVGYENDTKQVERKLAQHALANRLRR